MTMFAELFVASVEYFSAARNPNRRFESLDVAFFDTLFRRASKGGLPPRSFLDARRGGAFDELRAQVGRGRPAFSSGRAPLPSRGDASARVEEAS